MMGSEESKKAGGDDGGVVQSSSDVKVVERVIMSSRAPPASVSASAYYYELLMRLIGMCLTLVATIIVGVDKQSKSISYAGMHFHATAKWQYMSATVFFLVSNAIACSYAATSLVMKIIMISSANTGISGTRRRTLGVSISIGDLIMMGLLFSANGAAYAVGLIGKNGNSHVQWMRVCNVFDAYCRHVTAALVLSLIASSLFLLMLAHSLLKLHSSSSSTLPT